VIIADGVRPDVLARSIDAGQLPALGALRDEGQLSTITSAFPSVTGPAYAPFLMGRYPGSVGLPGLRWYDRSRRIARLPGHSRSYVGAEMRLVDRDIDRASPTIFELAKPSLGALSVIGRGLRRRERIGQSPSFVARAAATHFRGNVRGWLAIDREVGEEAARRLRTQRMRFAFIALTGIDKTSHAAGQDAQIVLDALRIVDDTVAQIRLDAERDGRWKKMHLWVGSDHGHSQVSEHEDLVALLTGWGYSTLAHPWAFTTSADIAVMVSGNAMTHLYLELEQKTRPWWPALGERWNDLAEKLLSRSSVDLLILPTSPSSCEIRAPGRGSATLTWSESRPLAQIRKATPPSRAWFPTATWALAACLMLVAALSVAWHNRQDRHYLASHPINGSTHEENSEAEIARDNQLMTEVNLEINRKERSPITEYGLSVATDGPAKTRAEARIE